MGAKILWVPRKVVSSTTSVQTCLKNTDTKKRQEKILLSRKWLFCHQCIFSFLSFHCYTGCQRRLHSTRRSASADLSPRWSWSHCRNGKPRLGPSKVIYDGLPKISNKTSLRSMQFERHYLRHAEIVARNFHFRSVLVISLILSS